MRILNKCFYSCWYGASGRKTSAVVIFGLALLCWAYFGMLDPVIILYSSSLTSGTTRRDPSMVSQQNNQKMAFETVKKQTITKAQQQESIKDKANVTSVNGEGRQDKKQYKNRIKPPSPLLSELSSNRGKAVLSIDNAHFMINGKQIQILSGAIHYFRVPPEYWKDRLKKLKACGLNTVETYIPWNVHEEQPGQFSFSGGLDIERFLRLAKEEGLQVILRPGPYICAEWDFGGLPAWLLSENGMKRRTKDPRFTKAFESYFAALAKKISPYQASNGGPIILVQVENEYAQYHARENDYMPWMRHLFRKHGIKEMLYTADSLEYIDNKSTLKNELLAINGMDKLAENLDKLRDIQPNKPLMVAEFWTGWFDEWRQPNHSHLSDSKYKKILGIILQKKASVNLYMFHGGTTFGFFNGANYNETSMPQHRPIVPSYDYDAPISESGQLTAKYFATCRMIAEMTETGYEYNERSLKGNIRAHGKWGLYKSSKAKNK